MNRPTFLFATLIGGLALLVMSCVEVQAQTQGQSTTGTSGGSSSFGSTSGSGVGSASSLQQARGFGLDSRFMGSGFGRFTGGSAQMGQTTAGAGAATSGAFGQSAGGGVGGGQSRFGNVGGIGGIGGFGGIGGLGGIGGMYGMGRGMFGMQNNQLGQQQGTIRTQMRLGFRQPMPASPVVTAQLGRTVNRVLQRDDYAGGDVNVTMDGSTAVLTGTVGSAHAREVVERLALLEPGISEVRNELTVNPAATRPESEPTPSTGDRRP